MEKCKCRIEERIEWDHPEPIKIPIGIKYCNLHSRAQAMRDALEYLSINLGIPLSEKERPSYEVCIACYEKVIAALKQGE